MDRKKYIEEGKRGRVEKKDKDQDGWEETVEERKNDSGERQRERENTKYRKENQEI